MREHRSAGVSVSGAAASSLGQPVSAPFVPKFFACFLEWSAAGEAASFAT
jgi:hypothetical protein